MAYENVKLLKSNFTMVDGYFYMMNEDVDALIVKTDDGTQAFSYPLDTTISNPIVSMEHDGRNFWTLESLGGNSVAIRRWYIHNYVCKLRDTFNLNSSGSHNYLSQAFTVEHYHRSFSGVEPAGSNNLSINDTSNMTSGQTLTLGPNSSGQIEEVTINSVGSGFVLINGTTTYAYTTNDPISFYSYIWLFNDYDGTTGGTGALYKISAYTGSYISKTAGGEFYGIKASTFYDMSYVDATWADALCYVRGTNTIFLNPADLNDNFGSMAMDNLEDDQATTIDIYDLAIEGANVYRLQLKATYYGTTGTFADSTYNYQLSTLDPFVTSISLSADPAILPANNTNESDITAIVKDQFNQPINGKDVNFTDDDTVGYITNPTVATNAEGVAETKYHSGTQAREVKITATAQQTT
jgi:hypothetical protein